MQEIPYLGAMSQAGFQEIWTLRLVDPNQIPQKTLTLQWIVFRTHNGFQRFAEMRVHFSQKQLNKRVYLCQTFDAAEFQKLENGTLSLASNTLSETAAFGSLCSKGNQFSWNLLFREHSPSHSLLLPTKVNQWITQPFTSYETLSNDLLFNGTTDLGGSTHEWINAVGSLTHQYGSRSFESWIWSQSNAFFTDDLKPFPLIFEGITAKSTLGPLGMPSYSSFYFLYKDQEITLNSLKDFISIKSYPKSHRWDFEAERGPLRFKGTTQCTTKDLVGIQTQNTEGQLLFQSQSNVADTKILIYRNGNLIESCFTQGLTSFERGSTEKDPYIEMMN